MFKALRDKFTSWFKKSESEEVKEKKQEDEKEKKAQKKSKKKGGKIEEKLQEIEEQLREKEKSLAEKPKTFLEKIFKKKETFEEEEPRKIKQVISEEPKEDGFFKKLTNKLSTTALTQQQFDEIFQELEITLLENNVALEAVDKIKESLSKDLVGIEVKKSEVESTIINSLKEAILLILIEPPDFLELINKKLELPFTIIFVGINGSGKTTTIAKIAYLLKKNNISCVLAAADTFRAASIEQLKEHAKRLNVPIIAHQYGSDPAAVAFDAKKYAKAHKIRVVLIDTAGRMYTKTNLIKEMEKIVRISNPDLKIFVGESITGNDATAQAKIFNEAINIEGIILTKADVDEKAGTILSVSHVTKKPIYYLGTGQSYSDLIPSTKKEIMKNLGLG